MNFYEAVVRFKKLNTEEENDSRALFAPADEKNPKNFIRGAFEGLNKSLGVRCDAKEAYSIFFWEAEKGKANLLPEDRQPAPESIRNQQPRVHLLSTSPGMACNR